MNTTTPVIREAPMLAERLLDLDGIARAFLEHREERLIHRDAGTCRTNGKWRALVGVVEVHHERREILDTVLQAVRSVEHTSELQSLMRITYADLCLNKKITKTHN